VTRTPLAIPRTSVPTPALVIDLDVLERNIATMTSAAYANEPKSRR
jgi:D-serine deaminase-like pyridoxal phosphate-dependent protein